MRELGLKQMAAAGVIIVVGLVVFLGICQVSGGYLSDSSAPIQVELHYPTAIPVTPEPTVHPTVGPNTAFRAVATVARNLDTRNGAPAMSDTDINPSPLTSTAMRYDWINQSTFHVADRVPDTIRRLVFPPCLDVGQPYQRYFYIEPESYGPPRSFNFVGSPFKIALLEREASGPAMMMQTIDGITYHVFITVERLDCRLVGGRVVEVYP